MNFHFPIIKPHLMKRSFSLFLNFSLLFLISLYTISTSPTHHLHHRHLQETTTAAADGDNCGRLRAFTDRRSKCDYVKTNADCRGDGYLNYLEIFYCSSSDIVNDSSVLGYFLLLLWLVILFYVLGDTTAGYFCPSVEGLSAAMSLSPTIAGTTLLPLGNGANDVFSSVISFTHNGNGDVGLNSVLGGALFITCFVAGVVSISVSSKRVRVDKRSFVRDVLFFLFVLCCLLVIMVFGSVTLWFALCFMCVYFLYIAVVSVMHLFCRRISDEKVAADEYSSQNEYNFGALETPLLGYVGGDEELGKGSPLLLQKDGLNNNSFSYYNYWSLFIYIVELPLSLPRKLTIPHISDENWSKPFATISATLAPILLATLFNTQGDRKNSHLIINKTSLSIYSSSILVGIFFGGLTLVLTEKSSPPKRFRFPWLAGCFTMSVVWTYIIVEELVSLMVSFGNILGISPAILGLTVLAWGNSLGDLISNTTMASRGGGGGGVQVAISGCYAGPLFNTLVGLGLSLVFAAWESYPASYPVPRDSDLFETVGFLMGGLLWALVVLPKRDMRLDKFLGIGLLAIYFCFLFLRIAKSVGLLNLAG